MPFMFAFSSTPSVFRDRAPRNPGDKGGGVSDARTYLYIERFDAYFTTSNPSTL